MDHDCYQKLVGFDCRYGSAGSVPNDSNTAVSTENSQDIWPAIACGAVSTQQRCRMPERQAYGAEGGKVLIEDPHHLTLQHHESTQAPPLNGSSALLPYNRMGITAAEVPSTQALHQDDFYLYTPESNNITQGESINTFRDISRSVMGTPAWRAMSYGGVIPADEDTEIELIAYQNRIKDIFDDISRRRLCPASDNLLHISQWLLTSITKLGLHEDNRQLREARLRRWKDFNYAWLALAHQQRELMKSSAITPQQSLLTEDNITELGDELIRLCDQIECYGLVDYEYGVWEERIEKVLEDCLNIYGDCTRFRADVDPAGALYAVASCEDPCGPSRLSGPQERASP